ncbi:MAG: hypothetical protein WCJ94_04920 [bacterium]
MKKLVTLVIFLCFQLLFIGGCLTNPIGPAAVQAVNAEYNNTLYGIGIFETIEAYSFNGSTYKHKTMAMDRTLETTQVITKTEFDSAVYIAGRITIGFTEINADSYKALFPSITHCYKSHNQVCTLCGDKDGIIIVEANNQNAVGMWDANTYRELSTFTKQ